MEYGPINGPVIGIVMKELARRAIERIRAERFIFEARAKVGRTGEMDDMVTSADRAAQQVYVRLLSECFPKFGIVAEEDELSVPCRLQGRELFFTVDPLDGTKAFVRRQSHGIGTMLSLVDDGEVIAACVGDVMTRELYYFRPGSDKVHRLSEFGKAERLEVDLERPLCEHKVLLRDEPEMHTPFTERLVHRAKLGGVFWAPETTGGSVGIGIARLWKGEIGAAVFHPGDNMPWDLAPIVGISKKLGFVFLELLAEEGVFRPLDISIRRTPTPFAHEVLLVHERRCEELQRWARGTGKASD